MTRKKEIGGYLELETFSGQPYHRVEDGAVALNSGRACLEYLIELRDIKTIWLPDWMCDCVPAVCEKHSVRVKEYKIGLDFRPVYDFVISAGEYLYLMDYYGQLAGKDVELAGLFSKGLLIVDEVQGFFRKPWPCADTLYTCRKFFGVADGAYLYTKDGARLEKSLPMDESHDHMGFVLGRYERPAGEFFAESALNNERFDDEPIKRMSRLTENLLNAVDYEKIRMVRERNFDYLNTRLGATNLLSVCLPEGAFMYPYMTRDACEIRSSLAEKGLYIPTFWPNCLNGCCTGSVAEQYSQYILPLPIDQRYSTEDMQIVVDALEGWMLR